MKCLKCETEINDGALFCPTCGRMITQSNAQSPTSYAPQYAYTPPQESATQTNVFAIVGFILSFLFTLLGLIFSIIGYVKAKTLHTGKGLSVAGITISVVKLILTVLLVVLFLIAIFSWAL